VNTPIVVGAPSASLLALIGDLPFEGTVVWSNAAELRESSEDLHAAGWDALLIDPEDESFSTAAMSHRSQIHGTASVVIVYAEAGLDVCPISTMVLRHLPEVPVVITGTGAVEAANELEEAATDLGIDIHTARDQAHLVDAIQKLSSMPAAPSKGI